MARYKLILAYDGTAFRGSQRQANHRTVQGELEKALGGLGWSGASVTLAGRTDTGVHASGQVAAFDLEWKHSLEALLRALNAGLPVDMAASEIEIAGEKFHPRFDASSRCYQYRLYISQVRDPLRDRTAWRVWPDIDGRSLKAAARLFLGEHDFAAFGSPPQVDSSTVRRVISSKWIKLSKDEWKFEVRADAFLYHMVRRMVFIQVAVGQGKCAKEVVVKILDRPQAKNEIPAGLAPAHGLTLIELTY